MEEPSRLSVDKAQPACECCSPAPTSPEPMLSSSGLADSLGKVTMREKEDVICGPQQRKRSDPTDPSPRTGHLSWDEYFMALAFLSAQRSKDPNKQVGACIVNQEHIILGIGYNGFPRGCKDFDLPWSKESETGNPLETKFPYVCHAEMNAILNSNSSNLQGARIYVTMFPCNDCAKLIIQSGIKEVIYYEAKISNVVPNSPNPGQKKQKDLMYHASQKMCHLAGVKLTQYQPERKITMTF